jgi:hypothetical protein
MVSLHTRRKKLVVVVTGYEGGVFGEIALRHCENSIGRTQGKQKDSCWTKKKTKTGTDCAVLMVVRVYTRSKSRL